MDDPWQIKVARFCVENSIEGFTEEMFKEFIRTECDITNEELISNFFDRTDNTYYTSFKSIEGISYFQASLETVQVISDYDELRLARRTAESADRNSKIAIGIALLTLIISAAVELGWLNSLSSKDNTINIKDSIHTDYIERHIFLD